MGGMGRLIWRYVIPKFCRSRSHLRYCESGKALPPKTKFRIYHGDADNIVPVKVRVRLIKALRPPVPMLSISNSPESIMAAGHRRSMILSLWVGCLIRRK